MHSFIIFSFLGLLGVIAFLDESQNLLYRKIMTVIGAISIAILLIRWIIYFFTH